MNNDPKCFIVQLNMDAVSYNGKLIKTSLLPRLKEMAQETDPDYDALTHSLMNMTSDIPAYVPVWLVFNALGEAAKRPLQCLFVWGWKAAYAKSAFGARCSFSGPGVLIAEHLAVQLTKDGEYVDLASAIKTGAAKWAGIDEEYRRTGFEPSRHASDNPSD